MQLSIASLAILFLVERVGLSQAGNLLSWRRIADASWPYLSEGYIESRTQQDAHAIVNRNLHLERDVNPSSTLAAFNVKASAIPSAAAAAADETNLWNKATEAACLKALSDRKDTTADPSGIAACYNIKSFDNTTGVFQADLRLYQTSPATGTWSTMKLDGVTLSCKGGQMGAGKLPTRKRDDTFEPWSHISRLRVFRRSTPSPPKMLQQMDFYGKIRDDLVQKNQTEDATRSLLAPTIALSATSGNGASLMTNLSANGTSFVNGEFALAASSSARATADSGFVMPGRKLGIFPVGLIITGAWTAIFLITISVGTVDRVRFRDAYRRRVRRELSLGVRTI